MILTSMKFKVYKTWYVLTTYAYILFQNIIELEILINVKKWQLTWLNSAIVFPVFSDHIVPNPVAFYFAGLIFYYYFFYIICFNHIKFFLLMNRLWLHSHFHNPQICTKKHKHKTQTYTQKFCSWSLLTL